VIIVLSYPKNAESGQATVTSLDDRFELSFLKQQSKPGVKDFKVRNLVDALTEL